MKIKTLAFFAALTLTTACQVDTRTQNEMLPVVDPFGSGNGTAISLLTTDAQKTKLLSHTCNLVWQGKSANVKTPTIVFLPNEGKKELPLKIKCSVTGTDIVLVKELNEAEFKKLSGQ